MIDDERAVRGPGIDHPLNESATPVTLVRTRTNLLEEDQAVSGEVLRLGERLERMISHTGPVIPTHRRHPTNRVCGI